MLEGSLLVNVSLFITITPLTRWRDYSVVSIVVVNPLLSHSGHGTVFVTVGEETPQGRFLRVGSRLVLLCSSFRTFYGPHG